VTVTAGGSERRISHHRKCHTITLSKVSIKVIFDKVIHFNGDFGQSDAIGNFLINLMTFDKVIFDEVIFDKVIFDKVIIDKVILDKVIIDKVILDKVIFAEVIFDKVMP
jgi:hypothetical protein